VEWMDGRRLNAKQACTVGHLSYGPDNVKNAAAPGPRSRQHGSRTLKCGQDLVHS
jgi:hypothetical protein